MHDVELRIHRMKTGEPEPGGARLDERIPAFMALGLGIAWVVIVGVNWATAPPPDPADPITATAYALSTLFLFALFGTAIGLGMSRRWGLVPSFGGGLLLLGAAAVCLAGGHSGIELYGQLGSGAFLTALTAGVWRST